MKPSAPDLHRFQSELSGLIREPNNSPEEIETEERRLKVYRELFFNNVEGFASGAFPVLKDVLGEDRWTRLVRQFFRDYHAKTPLFLQISEEFLTFLSQQEIDDIPYAQELAHWEWMELHADVTDTLDCPEVLAHIDLEDCIGLRDCAWPVAYQWPVHQISSAYLPNEPVATFLMVYRQMDWHVGFIELNPMSYLLLETLSTGEPLALKGRIAQFCQTHSLEYQAIEGPVMEVLNQWRQLGLLKVVGSK